MSQKQEENAPNWKKVNRNPSSFLISQWKQRKVAHVANATI
jgi:hypothetical protein